MVEQYRKQSEKEQNNKRNMLFLIGLVQINGMKLWFIVKVKISRISRPLILRIDYLTKVG